MMGLRVGSVLIARKNGWKLAGQKLSDAEQLKKFVDDRTEIEDRDILENRKDLLKFRRLPYEEWVGGTFLVAITLFLVWIINTEMAECDSHLGVNTLLALMMIGGITIVVRGNVVTTTFEGDKTDGTMMVVRSNILCMRMYDCYSLEDIHQVLAVRRGRKENGYNTVHYVLLVVLKQNGKHIRVLTTTNELRVKKHLLAVRQFLQQDLDKTIAISDELGAPLSLTKLEKYRLSKQRHLVPSKVADEEPIVKRTT